MCVLHNMPLVVEEGCLIRKTQACMRNMAYKSQTVPDVEDTPKVNPKDMIKWALDEYNRVYNQLVSEGYPAALVCWEPFVFFKSQVAVTAFRNFVGHRGFYFLHRLAPSLPSLSAPTYLRASSFSTTFTRVGR